MRRQNRPTDDDSDGCDVARLPVGDGGSETLSGLDELCLGVQLGRLTRLQFTNVLHRTTASFRPSAHAACTTRLTTISTLGEHLYNYVT